MIESGSISDRERRLRTIAATISLVAGVAILIVKFWAYKVTGSQAIYSDALESIVNILTALLGLFVVYYAALPVDEDHPYGHGKVEYFSAAFEGGLVTFAAVLVIYEAIQAAIRGEPIEQLDFGIGLSVAAGIANLLLGLMLRRVGKKMASPALEASAAHVITDFWTSFSAVVGLLLVWATGYKIIDAIAAVLMGLHMAGMGLSLVRKSIAGLLDAEDLDILRELAEVFERHAENGIIQIHDTKVIRSGWFHHIDAHVVVPEFWTVDEAHARLDVFEDKVIHEYRYGGEANFHLDPCRRNYCRACDFIDCKIRREPFEKRIPVVIEHLRSKEEPREFRS